MRRRELVASLAAAVWPLTTSAQQARTPVVGFLGLGSPTTVGPALLAATSLSTMSGQKASTIGCRRWRPSSFAGVSMSSLRREARPLLLLLSKLRHLFRSSFWPGAIPCSGGSSPASTGPAAT
jgi:hypothetical protein